MVFQCWPSVCDAGPTLKHHSVLRGARDKELIVKGTNNMASGQVIAGHWFHIRLPTLGQKLYFSANSPDFLGSVAHRAVRVPFWTSRIASGTGCRNGGAFNRSWPLLKGTLQSLVPFVWNMSKSGHKTEPWQFWSRFSSNTFHCGIRPYIFRYKSELGYVAKLDCSKLLWLC